MKLTGPGRVAALRELLLRAAELREVEARAGAAAEDHALAPDPVEDRLHRVVDREDEAGGALRLLLEADVEPDRRVERGVLVDEDRLQLGLERVGLLVGREVAALAAPAADRVDDAADHLLHAALALGRAEPPAEILLRDDVRRGLRPEARELDVPLLEGRPVLAGDERVAELPLDLVERVASRDREEAARGDRRRLFDDDVRDLVRRCSCVLHRAFVCFAVAILVLPALGLVRRSQVDCASSERIGDVSPSVGQNESEASILAGWSPPARRARRRAAESCRPWYRRTK